MSGSLVGASYATDIAGSLQIQSPLSPLQENTVDEFDTRADEHRVPSIQPLRVILLNDNMMRMSEVLTSLSAVQTGSSVGCAMYSSWR